MNKRTFPVYLCVSSLFTIYLFLVIRGIIQEGKVNQVMSKILSTNIRYYSTCYFISMQIQKLQRDIRERCRAIEGLTFLCHDKEMLQTCFDMLEKIRNDVQKSCPSDGGLLTEPNVSVPIVAKHGRLKPRKGLKKSLHTNKRKLIYFYNS